MTSSYQGLSGNRAGGADPTPEFLPAQQQSDKRLQQSIDRLNQSINSNAEARMLNAQRAGDAMQNLGRLSKTLGDALGVYQAGQIQKYQTEAQALAAIGITNQEQLIEAQTKREQEQFAAQQGLSEAQKKAAKDGAPYHVIDGIGKLNAYHLDEMQKIRIGEIAAEIPTQFKAFYTENDGASKSRADQLGLPGQFINNSYSKFDGLDPGLVAKYGLPLLNKFKQEARKDIDFQWGQTTSAQSTDRAINTLLVDGNIANYVNTVANTVDTKGKIRGEAGAYRYLVDKVLPKAIKANLVSVTDIKEMYENSERPGMGGKTYMDLNRVDYNTLDELIEADVAADYTRGEKLDNAKFAAKEDEWFQTTDFTTVTNDDIEKEQIKFVQDHGKRSKKLDQAKLHLTVDAVQLNEAETAIKRLVATNSLTSERLNKMPWQLQQKYASVAALTDKVAKDNYKVQLDAVKDAVELKARVTPLGSRHPSVGIVTSNYQRKFHENLRQQLEANNPNALNDALSITLQEFNVWSSDEGNYSHSTGYKVFADAATTQNLQANARVEQERVNSILRTFKGRSLDQVGLVNSTILRNDAANFGQKGFKHHPQIQRISRILQVDPITATNKMIEAYNAANQAQGNPIPLISLSPAAKVIRDDLPPQAKAQFLANQDQMTPNISLRVTSALPGDFHPEILPFGIGETVKKAGEKHDIPPAILAGLLEQETQFVPKFFTGAEKSPSGAIGPAQFLPETAEDMGVDPYDPESSIYGAAKYLRWIMDNYNYDLRTAIYAYNMGAQGVKDFGIAKLNTEEHKKYSLENYNYYPGVIKRAGKYGYKETFRDPSMIRPAFR